MKILAILNAIALVLGAAISAACLLITAPFTLPVLIKQSLKP